MVDSSLVTFLPSSKSRDTKTRPNIKNASRSKLDLPYFKNQWSVASSHCNWQRRQRLKIEGFPTLKGSWPWPILGHTAHCRASLIHLYLHAKFHWNQRSFFLWTDVCTYGQADRNLRPDLLGRLWRVHLKTVHYCKQVFPYYSWQYYR